MTKVLCTLPNAADEISGVKFTPVDGGMLSEELSSDRAAGFLAIPGYVEHAEEPAPTPAPAPAPVAVTQRPKKPAPVVPPAPPAVEPQPADGDADAIF